MILRKRYLKFLPPFLLDLTLTRNGLKLYTLLYWHNILTSGKGAQTRCCGEKLNPDLIIEEQKNEPAGKYHC